MSIFQQFVDLAHHDATVGVIFAAVILFGLWAMTAYGEGRRS